MAAAHFLLHPFTMTTAFEILAGDFLEANPPTARERAALAVARGDAELGQIVIQLMRVRRLAAKARLDRVVRYVQTADEHLDSIASGAWALPDGKARELVAEWRQDTRSALDTMLGALGSVHAIDAERAAPRLDAEDRQASANATTRERDAAAFLRAADRLLKRGYFVGNNGKRYKPSVAGVASELNKPKSTVFDWLEQDPRFRAAVARVLPQLGYASESRRRNTRAH